MKTFRLSTHLDICDEKNKKGGQEVTIWRILVEISNFWDRIDLQKISYLRLSVSHQDAYLSTKLKLPEIPYMVEGSHSRNNPGLEVVYSDSTRLGARRE